MSAALALVRPLVFFDLETTGVDVATDRIVEIAMRRMVPGADPEWFDTRINPCMPIPAEATAVHGISDADVAGSPEFRDIAPTVLRFVDGADFAGFGIARFDLPILRRELLDVGNPIGLQGRKVVDVLTLFHKKHPRDLASAVRLYCEREHDGAHGAVADTEAAIHVLNAMCAPHHGLPDTVDALHDFCGGDEGLAVDCAGKFVLRAGKVTFAFGKHDGKSLEQVARNDPGFLLWMLGKDFARDTKDLCRAALQQVSR